jgi:hypothetical protein
MRKTTSALAAVAMATALVAAAPSLAWARPEHHGSSGQRSGKAHHGFSGHHGGRAHHGFSRHHGGGSHHRFHGHGGFRTKVFVGSSVFFAPLFYDSYYRYPYSPSYVYPPPLVVQEPPVYIQQQPPTSTAPAEGYWYYCQSAGGYYPNVGTCPEQWIQVVPRAQ